MRIAIFADQLFYRQPGGIGTYIRHLVPGLAEELPEASFLLAHHGPSAAEPLFPCERTTMRRLPSRRDVTGLLWHTVEKPLLESYLGPLDLVHAPSLVCPPSEAPLVATVHDLCVLRFPGAFPARWRVFHRRGLTLILRRAKRILVDSYSTARDLHVLGGKRDGRICVVPLGVDRPPDVGEEEVDKVLRKHRLSPGYLLFVGTVEPRKNLSRLVQAYASLDLADRKAVGELVLVGAPGWMGRRELSRILSQDGVRWLGHLPEGELEAVYRGAGIFVYPSLYEGFGLPVLEAMARKIPVITSRTSSLLELAEGAAFLVDPEEVMEIRRAMRRLIRDGELRAQLAELGAGRAAEYPWSRTVRLTGEAFREMLC